MKVLFSFCLLLSTFFSLAASPNFAINNQSDLNSLKGQVVYIDFWASWCKPCRASFPWMNEMHEKYANQGLKIIAINLDEDTDNAKHFLDQVPALFDIVYDPTGKIAQQYALVGMPSSYLIDKNGDLQVTHQGFFSQKADAYENEIVQLLGQ